MNKITQCLEQAKEVKKCPSIKTFISILLKSMENKAIGAQYYNHNKSEVVVKTTAFVDNVSTHHTSTQELSLAKGMA